MKPKVDNNLLKNKIFIKLRQTGTRDEQKQPSGK
jgi:hypothetical protein